MCRCKHTDRVLIFANTHLFYHPSAAFVRLLQTDAIIRTVMHVRNSITELGISCLETLVIEGEERDAALQADLSTGQGNQIQRQAPSSDRSRDRGSSDSEGVQRPRQDGDTAAGGPVAPPTVSILFMGDLNSTPETAVIEYFDK